MHYAMFPFAKLKQVGVVLGPFLNPHHWTKNSRVDARSMCCFILDLINVQRYCTQSQRGAQAGSIG